MDLIEFIRLLLRHWFVVGLTLAATAVAAVMFSGRVETEYEAHGSLLLLTPSSVESPTGRVSVNPYTRLGTTERVASTLLVNISLSQSFVTRMERQGVRDYRVTVDPSGGGAIVNLDIVGATSSEAVRGLEVVRQALAEELANRQERSGAPRDTWITLEILTFPTRGSLLTGSRTRVLAAVAVLGAGLAASLAVLAESVRPKRQRRKRKYVEDVGHDPAEDVESMIELPMPPDVADGRKQPAEDGQPAVERPRLENVDATGKEPAGMVPRQRLRRNRKRVEEAGLDRARDDQSPSELTGPSDVEDREVGHRAMERRWPDDVEAGEHGRAAVDAEVRER